MVKFIYRVELKYMKKKDIKNNKKTIDLIFLALFILIITVTIGYATFAATFSITNSVATIRVDRVVRVTKATSTSIGVSNLDYSQSSIVNTLYLQNGGSVTYNFDVTNLGNVPIAIADVKITDDANHELSGVTYSFNNYTLDTKVCNSSNVCVNNITRTIGITLTNNTGSTIDSNLDVHFTFAEVYNVNYKGNKIGEAVSGKNYTYTFTNNIPTHVAITSGTYDSFTYNNGVLNIMNVTSDITVTDVYNINYNGSYFDEIEAGGNYTHTFSTEWPKSVTLTGTYDNYNYNDTSHLLTINNVGSDISITPVFGKIEITDIDYIEGINVLNQQNPTFSDMSANFNVTFKRADDATTNDFKATYEVELTNDSYSNYIFRGFDFNPVITASSDEDSAVLHLEVEGVTNGETLAPGSSKRFRVILVLEANNPNGTYGTQVGTEVDTTKPTTEEGELVANITSSTNNLQAPNTRATVNVEVVNTFSTAKEFTWMSSNSNLQLIDASGNPLEPVTIAANSTENYTIYVKANDGAMFSQNTANTTILLSSNGIANVTVDTLTFNVDVSQGVDNTKVTVGNAVTAMNGTPPTPGRLVATWNRIDSGGSEVIDYTVLLYNDEGTLKGTGHTNSSLTTYTFNDLEDDGYYIVVYGEDAYHNSGAEDAAGATQNSGYATRSATTNYKWRFNVDTSGLENLDSSGGSVAYLNDTYKTTLSASGTWTAIPNSTNGMTVTMGGRNLTAGSGYTYDTSSGVITIPNVTGDITITASARTTCLIEGTKILMANGKYKNIENINYDDLLMVYSYETGSFVPMYPIWIEKTKTTTSYQQNTFSDGTILNTLGYHGIYETNLNRFVSVDKAHEFKVGSKIAKLNKDLTGFDTVTVTDIEYKRETKNYYHVVSTRYYNIIANDLLTTDGTVILSNLYGFNKDITWNKELRAKALKDTYSYDDLKSAIPYYMYKGLRAEEGKFLANYGLDLETFKYYLIMNQNNSEMLKEPIQRLNKNVWMVTTSEDNVTDLNKHNYLRYEGSTVTLSNGKNNNVKGWLNTSDNKVYLPNDTITVYHGIHLIAIYK